MTRAFPKIFRLGSKYVSNILNDEIECTEKIDGSQFIFYKIDNELHTLSRGAKQYLDCCDTKFKPIIQYINSIESRIPKNIIFYGETLAKPKHNILKYDNVPKNNLALFGGITTTDNMLTREELEDWSKIFEVDIVPILYKGKATNEIIQKLLKNRSYLGGVDIEGVVIKNYKVPLIFGNMVFPLMCAKLVSEEFREIHQRNRKDNAGKGKWEIYCQSFNTKARWMKAIQHLRERGELEYDPRDIGKLLKEINSDIEEEEKENIKEYLYNEFKKDIFSRAKKGFAEWYKEYLLKKEE